MKKYMFLGAALLLFTASCSNDDNNNETKEQVQAVQFSFTNEDFGEDETPTRTAEIAKPQTIDLGDCEAEISVESEPVAKKTRGALSPANGHYTIRAYQAGTLKGEMSGTFSGGTFTPDASSKDKLRLPYGTYDFVAFNDDVTVSGTELKVNRTDVETARMGFATVTITGPTPIQVQFTMKHVGARLRIQFLCQKDIPNNITATLEATAANVIPTSVAYNPATKAYTSTNGAMTAESNNLPASTESKYTASNYGTYFSYTSTSTDYHYFLPTTEGSKLKIVFSAGTVFWNPLTGTIPQLNATLSMQPNKSYFIKIKLKPQFTYLMSDGTTGYFKDTTFGGGTKTPIAVVVSQSKRLAVALKDASSGGIEQWCTLPNKFTQKNKAKRTDIGDWLNLENGYHETWDASASMDNVTVKGNSTDYPPFRAAGHYNPGVPVSGTMVGKRWFLPSYGEWKYLIITYFGNIYEVTTFGVSNLFHVYGNLGDAAFLQVGGSDFYNWYWLSSEHTSKWAGMTSLNDGGAQVFYQIKSEYYRIRPFIYY